MSCVDHSSPKGKLEKALHLYLYDVRKAESFKMFLCSLNDLNLQLQRRLPSVLFSPHT